MREFFVAFRSRSDAVRFYEELKGYRIPAKLINTPSSAGIGCGLSVKLLSRDLPQTKTVLSRSNYSSAAGLFYLDDNGRAILM